MYENTFPCINIEELVSDIVNVLKGVKRSKKEGKFLRKVTLFQKLHKNTGVGVYSYIFILYY